MSGEVASFVVTVVFNEKTLTDINELNNHLTRAGFTLTLTEDNGKIHELGTNTFGIVSSQSESEIRALTEGLAETALGYKPDVTIMTFDSWLKDH